MLAPMPPVGLLTAGVWHDSIGDVATAQATVDGLALRGIPVRQLPWPGDARPSETLVIGGGGLLTRPVNRAWDAMLDYRVRGPHVLNAVGINVDSADDEDDLSYLREYRLVSVRDEVGAEALARFVDDVSIVPCPATLVPSMPFSELVRLPDFSSLSELEPSGYAVVHRHPSLERVPASLEMPTVVVDMQAWIGRPWCGGGLSVPTRSPTVAMTLVRHARCVFGLSLHLAIFALASGVPFSYLDLRDRQGRKVTRYLVRAGIDSTRCTEWQDLPAAATDNADAIRRVGALERVRAEAHLDAIATALP